MLLDRLHELCIQAVSDAFGTEVESVTIDFPDEFGDLALNCFYLAKTLRQAPPRISAALAERLEGVEMIEKADAVSGYVNFTIDRAELFRGCLSPVLEETDVWSDGGPSDDARKIMVEFSSPNTNKPQHLGHVRNNCLGDSLSRILEAAGNRVVRANLVNDRGIHICKSMLAYAREGGGATPESTGTKGDHFVGEYYVLFEKRLVEEWEAYKAAHPDEGKISKDAFFKIGEWGQAAQAMLLRWEAGDEETVSLWSTMNGWVMEGFDQTYSDLGIAFDRVYLESETYGPGKEIVEKGVADGHFYRRDDGAIEVDLSSEKLGKKVLLRSDGTSVYMTQDIGTTPMKAAEFGLDGQVWVVGNEQIHHFKVLISVLKRLGYPWAEGLYHLAYGMVNLPEGKMKSREGKVVDADDLVREVTDLAAVEIRGRDADISEEDLAVRARRIGLSALKFMILGVSPKTTMMYDPKASVSFEGDTGPYVMYAFARIRRMVLDGGVDDADAAFDASTLGDPSEVRLALSLLEFPGVVQRAARDYNPALITGHLLKISKAYHSHNREVPILKAEDEATRRARLQLSRATAATLKKGLGLLGIETVDRM